MNRNISIKVSKYSVISLAILFNSPSMANCELLDLALGTFVIVDSPSFNSGGSHGSQYGYCVKNSIKSDYKIVPQVNISGLACFYSNFINKDFGDKLCALAEKVQNGEAQSQLSNSKTSTEIDVLKSNIKSLSDANDALTKRLNELEKKGSNN